MFRDDEKQAGKEVLSFFRLSVVCYAGAAWTSMPATTATALPIPRVAQACACDTQQEAPSALHRSGRNMQPDQAHLRSLSEPARPDRPFFY